MTTLPHHLSQEDAPKMWVHFRALEWFALPAFISQPVLPVTLALFPRWEILLIIYCVDILWRFACHTFVSTFVARVAYFVWRLPWHRAHFRASLRSGLAATKCLAELIRNRAER